MSENTPINELAEAQSASELLAAHRRVRKAVMAARKADQTAPSLGTIVTEAMRLWDQMRVDGASLRERVTYLAGVLKASWPKPKDGRTEPWHYLCDACEDTGLTHAECPGDSTCGRVKAHGPHTFGSPCWCDKGRRFREPLKPSPEDFRDAGKSKAMTRAGRR